jgi:hypothetical protein
VFAKQKIKGFEHEEALEEVMAVKRGKNKL